MTKKGHFSGKRRMPTLPTATKEQKVQKIRNAEYYDFQGVQDTLYTQSKENKVFRKLMTIILSEENIMLAYRNIKKNTGSHTPGVDGKTIKDLSKWQEDSLITYIRTRLKHYIPQPVRRVEIPKANGKTRPLGIPTIMDRLIQQCVLQVMEPICEAKFHERNNGFRPCRSAEHAIAQVYKFVQRSGLHFVVDIDIKGFFDNVQHGKLLKQLWQMGIRDKTLLSILSAMLKAEVAEIGFPERGTPQGGIISPLLANVVLNELDWWISSQWETMPTHHQYAVTIAPNGTASRGKTYRALQSTQLKECWIVRYADDFKILCRKRSDAVKLFAATQQWLKARLGLDISPEKSGIVNLKKHYTEFLGIKIRVRQKGKKANGSPGYTAYSGMTDKAYQAMKSKVQQHTRAMAHPADTNDGSRAVDAYNAYVLGIHNYYRIATNITLDMRKIAFLVKHELNARLRRYTQKSGDKLPSYIAERYGNSKMLRYVYGRALIPIGYLKHKAPMFKPKKVNRYTPEGRAEIHKSLSCVNISILREMMRNPIMDRSVEYNDNRLSLYCGQMGRCYVTKQPLELGHMHCHHRIPRHFGGDDKYGNLVLVTDEVHRLLHATQPDTIAHYMLKLKPDSKQLRTLNRLRRWLQLPEFRSYTSY